MATNYCRPCNRACTCTPFHVCARVYIHYLSSTLTFPRYPPPSPLSYAPIYRGPRITFARTAALSRSNSCTELIIRDGRVEISEGLAIDRSADISGTQIDRYISYRLGRPTPRGFSRFFLPLCPQGPPQPNQQFKFTIAESCDRIKEEFNFLQSQYHA